MTTADLIRVSVMVMVRIRIRIRVWVRVRFRVRLVLGLELSNPCLEVHYYFYRNRVTTMLKIDKNYCQIR